MAVVKNQLGLVGCTLIKHPVLLFVFIDMQIPRIKEYTKTYHQLL